MGKVVTAPSMSLDGFIAGPSARLLRESFAMTGAAAPGRRTFGIAKGWGGRHPVDAPVFVVTHAPAPEWVQPDWPFTTVPEGVERVVERAREVAGEKNVGVGAASIVQQCPRAGASGRNPD